MTASAPPTPSFARRHWGKLTILSIVSTLLLVFGAWSAFAIFVTYSEGTRTGYAQKLSYKGWICKTWEGEIAMSTVPGVMPEKFTYTVHGDSLAEAIRALEGKKVTLAYKQHRFVPSRCFGESEYWATGVKAAEP